MDNVFRSSGCTLYASFYQDSAFLLSASRSVPTTQDDVIRKVGDSPHTYDPTPWGSPAMVHIGKCFKRMRLIRTRIYDTIFYECYGIVSIVRTSH